MLSLVSESIINYTEETFMIKRPELELYRIGKGRRAHCVSTVGINYLVSGRSGQTIFEVTISIFMSPKRIEMFNLKDEEASRTLVLNGRQSRA
jgi:hypothetical protein